MFSSFRDVWLSVLFLWKQRVCGSVYSGCSLFKAARVFMSDVYSVEEPAGPKLPLRFCLAHFGLKEFVKKKNQVRLLAWWEQSDVWTEWDRSINPQFTVLQKNTTNPSHDDCSHQKPVPSLLLFSINLHSNIWTLKMSIREKFCCFHSLLQLWTSWMRLS